MKPWPPGILSRVSREAYNAVGRARSFPFMTPAEREAAAVRYDELKPNRTRSSRKRIEGGDLP